MDSPLTTVDEMVKKKLAGMPGGIQVPSGSQFTTLVAQKIGLIGVGRRSVFEALCRLVHKGEVERSEDPPRGKERRSGRMVTYVVVVDDATTS